MKGHRFIIGRKLCEIASTLEKKKKSYKNKKKTSENIKIKIKISVSGRKKCVNFILSNAANCQIRISYDIIGYLHYSMKT